MQRNVRLIANDPAVVRYRRDVKELSRSQLDDASIIECSRRGAGEHQSNVLNVAPSRAHAWADVLAPLPPCFISGATNRYPAEMHQFEATFSITRTSSGASKDLRITAISSLLMRDSTAKNSLVKSKVLFAFRKRRGHWRIGKSVFSEAEKR